VREAGETKKQYADRHYERKEFWQRLLEKAKSKTKLHSNISPGMYNWIGTSSGVRGLHYNYTISQHNGKVELYIDYGDNSKEKNLETFNFLLDHKAEIEAAFGSELEWDAIEGKRGCKIAKIISGGGYKDKDNWDEIINKMIDAMIKLEKSTQPFIKKLGQS
jgi:hypothetical protein